ncbi:MAG TPA: CcmD family protein [Cryomorphaceae bacterium]|nr:CcmD family protein [Owenweeksia sp.]HAD98329.1 CcmD family protein [Cryomorphaceae bacterium]HBF21371.1 CcmD family protein [Cryomorphaceae bacterium]|tara:strand:+ start:60 stop:290 length:231 start_codon:yes stop_codon:yes gene_type:complete
MNNWIKIKTLFFTIITTLTAASLHAQAGDVEMANMMRENGKIYVVVAILSVIFIGIVIYLISIDRKLRKLEKEQKA